MHARFRPLVAAALVVALAAGCGSDDDSSDEKETTTTEAEQTTETTAATTDTTDTSDTTATEGEVTAPTKEEVAAGLERGLNMTPEVADCVAQDLMVELTPENLRAVANNTPESVAENEADAMRQTVSDAIASCS
jgi:hypothetical protein